jgi:hypothetical protein
VSWSIQDYKYSRSGDLDCAHLTQMYLKEKQHWQSVWPFLDYTASPALWKTLRYRQMKNENGTKQCMASSFIFMSNFNTGVNVQRSKLKIYLCKIFSHIF